MILTPREKKGNRSIKPARVIESNRQLMEGACCVIVAVDVRRRKGSGEVGRGRILFRILCAIRHVPHARCEEVTLRLRVPHPCLPGDRCAEHGPQEYGPAAGKGQTEEAPGPVHAGHACRHRHNPIKCVFYRFTPTMLPRAHTVSDGTRR